MKIRIITGGIFGLPLSDESPNGEYPIGHVIDLGDNDAPTGWTGRYEEVSGKIPEGAVAVTNEDRPRRGRPAGNHHA